MRVASYLSAVHRKTALLGRSCAPQSMGACYFCAMSASTPLDDASYISLRSFRRDGTPVDTPVWFAKDDATFVVFTLRESYKVRRVKRNPSVQVARCDVRGKLQGPWHDGRCTLIEPGSPRERQAYAALLAKYGWQMRIGNVLSSLSGRRKRRVVLAIELAT